MAVLEMVREFGLLRPFDAISIPMFVKASVGAGLSIAPGHSLGVVFPRGGAAKAVLAASRTVILSHPPTHRTLALRVQGPK